MAEVASWLALWPEVLRALAFLVLPGYLLAAVLGLDRVWRIFATPLLVACWAPVVAFAYHYAHIPFTSFTFLASTLVIALVVYLVRGIRSGYWVPFAFPQQPTLASATPSAGMIWVGVVLAAVFAASPLAHGMGSASMPPQTYDSVYHLNAVRAIVRWQDGSPAAILAHMNPWEKGFFYPPGWHDAVALIASENVVGATNLMVVLGVIVAACYAGFAASLVFPRSRYALAFGVIAASVYVAFPARLVSYGTVWPVFWSYIWVAAAIAIVLALWRIWRNDTSGRKVQLYVLLIAAVIAAGFAQPAAVFALVYLLLLLVVIALILRACGKMPGFSRGEVTLAALLLLASIGGVFALSRLALFRNVVAYANPVQSPVNWAPWTAISGAQLFNQGYGSAHGYWILVVLTLLGVVVTLVQRQYWLVCGWIFVIGLYTVSLTNWKIALLAAPWYSNSVRIGGLVPLLAAPIVGVALTWVHYWLTQLLTRRIGSGNKAGEASAAAQSVQASQPHKHANSHGSGKTYRIISFLVACVLIFTVGAATNAFRKSDRSHMVYINYVAKNESGLNGLITPAEVAMLEKARHVLPPDAVIIGSPLSGAPLISAISDRRVVYPAMGIKLIPALKTLAARFPQLPANEEVCAILNQFGARYFYWDPVLYWPDVPGANTYRGFHDAQSLLPYLKPVLHGGTATIYEIPESVCPRKK